MDLMLQLSVPFSKNHQKKVVQPLQDGIIVRAFEAEAHKDGLYAKSINGDAFSNEIKAQTINLIKKDLGQIDLLIYSLASPVRTHPDTGERFKSVLKPIGKTFTDNTVDFHTGEVKEISIKTCRRRRY